jgi:AcrR family transcriptional regulator
LIYGAIRNIIVAVTISQAQSRGRPRDPRIDDAVTQAAIEVFRERGYPDASLIEIARRAKVGTPALYRRWRSKSALALDLVAKAVLIPVVDTGDIRRDLAAFVAYRIRTFDDPLYRHVLLALTTIAIINPEVGNGVRSIFQDAQRPMLERLERARNRGELAASVDCNLVLNMAVGTVAVPLIFTGEGRSEADAEKIVAAVLDGVA